MNLVIADLSVDNTTMAELSNIQVYEKIDDSNFRPILDRFCNVLKSIDLWNGEIKTAFDNFEWKVEDSCFVYSSITQLGHFASKLSSVKMRPLVMVYTPAIDATFKGNWICCELLIETEELRNFTDGQFHSHTYDLVKALAFEMQKEFKQTGIYFTDEVQDGSDFDGIRRNDLTKLWRFDYALIPKTLDNLYSKKPVTHNIKRHENYFETWYIDRWKEKL
jgi:hypothetical protein